MAVLNDSIVQGDLRVIGNLYANISGKSTSAENAEKAASATKALQDSYGTTINASSYKTKQTVSAWTGSTTQTITSFAQDANGVVTPVFGNIRGATIGQTGITQLTNTVDGTTENKAITPKGVSSYASAAVANSHTHSNKSKLDKYTNAGSSANPVYIASNGTPTEISKVGAASNADTVTTVSWNNVKDFTNSTITTAQTTGFASPSAVAKLVNDKIAGVYQLQGDASWSSISGNDNNKKNGYVYNITGGVDNTSGSDDKNGNRIKVGDNIVYTTAGSAGWDKLASTIDLSPYQTIAGMTAYSQSGHTHKISAITDLTAYTGSTAFTRAGNLTANSFSASAGSTLAALTAKSHVSVSGNVSATGNFSAKGNVIGAAMTATSNVSVSGNISAAGAISSKGNITTTGTLIGASAKITNISATTISGVTDVSATNIKADVLSANSLNLNGDASVNTLNANEAVINGAARVLGTLYADTIEGKITSASNADKALNADKVGGIAPSTFASASQLANYVTTGTNQIITGLKTFSSNNFLEALRVVRNHTGGGAAIGLYPKAQTTSGWGINADVNGNLNIGKITNTTALDTTSALFVYANGTVKATTFSGNLSGVARSALSATTAYVASSTIPINLHNGYKEYTWSSTNDDTWENFIKDASASTASFACKVFGSGLDTTEKTINAIGRLNLTTCTGTNSSAIKQNLVADSYPMFHVVATRHVGYVEFYNKRRRIRYNFGRFGGLVTANYDNLYKTVVTSAYSAGSATTANIAKTLTATISASYISLSAGSANLAGTATSATSSNWNNLINKPSTFTPASHNHSQLTAKDITSSAINLSSCAKDILPSKGINYNLYVCKTQGGGNNISGYPDLVAAGTNTSGNFVLEQYLTRINGDVDCKILQVFRKEHETWERVITINNSTSSVGSWYTTTNKWNNLSAFGGTTNTTFALGNHTHSNSGSYLTATYATNTASTFSGLAASAGVASTAKKASWNQKDDDRNYKVAISLDSEFDYDTPFEYNPASGKLTVPSATKVGGCTMTWNASTSALDFTF